jgi:hypothetical protein
MPAGRPSIISRKLQDEICKAIRAGNYMETAAAYAGVSKDSLYEWMKRGAVERRRREHWGTKKKPGTQEKRQHTLALKNEQPYLEFSDAVQKALADSEVADLLTVGKAAKGGELLTVEEVEKVFPDGRTEKKIRKEMSAPQWQAAAWKLERRFPDKYGRRERLEHVGPEGGPIEVSSETPDERVARLKARADELISKRTAGIDSDS